MGLKICDVAEQGGVNLQSFRITSDKGFLPEPPRLASGYRVYPGRHSRQETSRGLDQPTTDC